MAKKKIEPLTCPCGQTDGQSKQVLLYEHCCAPYLNGDKQSETAELLMRSRYSAYARNNEQYILQTWHPDTRPDEFVGDGQIKWLGLTVLSHQQQDQEHAAVEFVARYKSNGRAFKLRELSRFVKINQRWFYLDGDINEA